ncbi:RsmB/NOP family class I SAM-dependent RNA methyltransferase [Thalassolituus sp. LLYu03]|uniref:RsmB/NOP family class I SAM-dependent RNA methyltransferase n=1 Tax=Thalassolituus sp. LLYu03 TaxID=3421656 RepID=UPI003D2B2AEC
MRSKSRSTPRRPSHGRPQARHPLITLWSQWCAMAPRPALDRWLRGQLRNLNSEGQWTPALISRAMADALRYQQLACALEDVYTGRAQLVWTEADWAEWDGQWAERRLSGFQAQTLWSWIERRAGERWDFARLQKDDQDRSRLLKQVAYQAEQSPLSALGLMWQGVRPQWLPLLQQRASASRWDQEQLLHFIRQQNQLPPLWLRVNPLRRNPLAQPDDAQALKDMLQNLRDGGINAAMEKGHLAARGGKGVDSSELYRSGQLEIQDLASQQIAAALNPQPGDKIWDACAGAGGKTLALAGPMNNKGALVATDLHQYKLDELKRRASRAGAHNVRTFVWNGTEALRLPQEIARNGGFDKVLVDAPCSSAGTWRRNPDARWRFSDDDTADLNELQLRLLSLAGESVKAGGLLVYATCSWAVAENEDLVARFLSNNPAFSVGEMRLLGLPQDDSDTMFVALLNKAEAN